MPWGGALGLGPALLSLQEAPQPWVEPQEQVQEQGRAWPAPWALLQEALPCGLLQGRGQGLLAAPWLPPLGAAPWGLQQGQQA